MSDLYPNDPQNKMSPVPVLPGNVGNSQVSTTFADARSHATTAAATLTGLITQLLAFVASLHSLDSLTVTRSATPPPPSPSGFVGSYTPLPAPLPGIPPSLPNAPTPIPTPSPVDFSAIIGIDTGAPASTGVMAVTIPVITADSHIDVSLSQLPDISINPNNRPIVPNIDFNFNDNSPGFVNSEDPYVSNLRFLIEADIADILENGASLSPVEQDILDREKERDILINQDAMSAVADIWGQRGFLLPSNGLFDKLTQVQTEYQNKKLDKSRAIAEESRKVALASQQFAVETGVKLEDSKMIYWSKLNDRALQRASEVVKNGLAILDYEIKKRLGALELFGKEIEAFVADMQLSKAKADVGISLINAETSREDLKTRVAIASGQIASSNNADLNKAAVAEADIVSKKTSDLINSNTANAELKVKKIAGMASVMTANADTSMKVSVANAQLQDTYQGGVAKSKSAEAEIVRSNVESVSRTQSANAELLRTYNDGMFKKDMSNYEAAKTDFELQLRHASFDLQATIAEFESHFKVMETDKYIHLEALKAQVQIAAQMVASALSTIHASAGLDASFNSTVHSSISMGETWNHSIKEKDVV
jgi:hypothetical protein